MLQQNLSAGDLTSFVASARGLGRQITWHIKTMQYLKNDVKDLRELARFYATPTKIGLGRIDGHAPLTTSEKYWCPTKKEEEEMAWSVEFDNVCFAYPSDRKTSILNGFSITIKAGQMVGLCGKTHCGKSTVLRLLERLYDVDSGSITVCGQSKHKWLHQSGLGFSKWRPIIVI